MQQVPIEIDEILEGFREKYRKPPAKEVLPASEIVPSAELVPSAEIVPDAPRTVRDVPRNVPPDFLNRYNHSELKKENHKEDQKEQEEHEEEHEIPVFLKRKEKWVPFSRIIAAQAVTAAIISVLLLTVRLVNPGLFLYIARFLKVIL